MPTPAPAREVPTSLKQLWTAASPATRVPVVVGGTVATGDGRQVDGRDPATGESLWSYARDTDLCGVTWVYHYAVAVYRYDRGCGQVSTIDGSTGRRGAARSGYADPRVRLFSDGTTVLSAGDTRLELWRSDMVRMLAYGEIDARVKPSNRGLQSGCTLESAAASSAAVSVLEACTNQADLRLVLLRPGKEDDEPIQRIVPEPGVRPGSRPGIGGIAEQHRRVPACKIRRATESRRDRRDRRHSFEHAAGQATVNFGRGVADRQPGDLVDGRRVVGLRRGQPDPALHHCRWRDDCAGGARGDDGRSTPGAGHRRDRCL